MATIFRIKLAKVQIQKNGHYEKFDESRGIDVENGVEATLVYPTPGAPAVKSMRTMKLKEGQEIAYFSDAVKRELRALLDFLMGIQLPDIDMNTLDGFIQSQELSDFKKLIKALKKFRNERKTTQLENLRKKVNRLFLVEEFNLRNLEPRVTLFRQPIKGDCMLEVQISAARKANEFEKLFTSILFAGVKGAASTITGFKGVTAMATTAIGSLLEMFAPKDNQHIIAYGTVPFSESTPVNQNLRVDLYIPNSFTIKTPLEYDRHITKITKYKEIKFEKGDTNGYAEFTLVKEQA